MKTAYFWALCVLTAIVSNLLAICLGYGATVPMGTEKVITLLGSAILAFVVIMMMSAIHSEVERVIEKFKGMPVPLFAKIMIFAISFFMIAPIHLTVLGSQWATGG